MTINLTDLFSCFFCHCVGKRLLGKKTLRVACETIPLRDSVWALTVCGKCAKERGIKKDAVLFDCNTCTNLIVTDTTLLFSRS